jgi:hypothetical protein
MRPATEVILSSDSLGNGWTGTVTGSDAQASAILNNNENTFNVHIIKFDSFTNESTYYENDIAGMGGESLNIGEKAVTITMGPASKLIEFYWGNIVATLLWNIATSSLTEHQMEQFANIQNERIGV